MVAVATQNVAAQVTRHVPAQFASIQAAIVASSPADRVIVAPGTYVEHIDFLGKAVKLESSGGYGVTTISGGGQTGHVVKFVNGESSDTLLRGFTIRNATATYSSVPPPPPTGGILCLNASPRIKNCSIQNNAVALGDGGGLHIEGGDVVIEDCYICNNGISTPLASPRNGGGMAVFGPATLKLTRTRILSNHSVGRGGGIALIGGVDAHLESCRITGNSVDGDPVAVGGGISLSTDVAGDTPSVLITSTVISYNDASGLPGGAGAIAGGPFVTLVNCTIVANTVGWDATSPWPATWPAVSGAATYHNCIIWENHGVWDPIIGNPLNVALPQYSPQSTLTYCCVQDPAIGGTNISSNPGLFGSYRLQATSPCRDSGAMHPAISALDDVHDPRIIGPAVDRGADEYPAGVAGTTGSVLDGNVGAATGALQEVLFIDGEVGGLDRRIQRFVGDPMNLSVASPSTWGPTPYLLMVETAIPVDPVPYALPTAVLAFAPPVATSSISSFVVVSSIGVSGGTSNLSAPAPVSFGIPGIPFPIELLLQAVVVDPNGLLLASNGIRLLVD